MIINNDKKNPSVKIIDFGLSEIYNKNKLLKNKCGTGEYIAPEIEHKLITKKSDIWSLGIILYIMLCGEHPIFNNDGSTKQTKRFSEPIWKILSSEVKNLIDIMLEFDYKKRADIDTILQHKWFKNKKKIINKYENNKTPDYKRNELFTIIKNNLPDKKEKYNTPDKDKIYKTPDKKYNTLDCKRSIIKKSSKNIIEERNEIIRSLFEC